MSKSAAGQPIPEASEYHRRHIYGQVHGEIFLAYKIYYNYR